MSGSDLTIEMLRRGAGREPLDPAEWKRVKARFAWVGEMLAALHDAQDRMHERCRAAVNRVSEAEFERICDEEQAKVDALMDALKAVADRDEWPRHLYWSL